MWSIWNFKIEMFKFGCVNTESWNLKTNIWNLFVKCLEGIWNFENKKMQCLNTENWNVWILKIEMSEYWKLKCLNIENWKLKCLNTENWHV
jgi:hypothetical protein